MSVSIGNVSIDTNDLAGARTFWQSVTGYEIASSDDDTTYFKDPKGTGTGLSLQRVPEPRSGKNRIHVDLTTDDLDGEVKRIIDLGATEVADFRSGGWVVLADPEGNQFCVCAG